MRRSWREIERAVDDLEPRDGLEFVDFLKLANGEATPEEFDLTEPDLDREWAEFLRRNGVGVGGDRDSPGGRLQ